LIAHCSKLLKLLWTRSAVPHPESPGIVWWRAYAHYCLGDFCSAAIDFERAVEMHHALGNVPSDHAVICQYLLGRTLLWTGRPAEAEEKFAEAFVWLDHMPEPEQTGRGFVQVDLAQLHRFEGEFEAAEHLLLQAKETMQHYYGSASRHVGFVYFHMASVYERQGRTSPEDAAMEGAIRILRSSIKEDDDGFSTVLSFNGLRLKRRGRLEESRACQVEALAILQRIRKPGHYLMERVKHRLAMLDEASASSAG